MREYDWTEAATNERPCGECMHYEERVTRQLGSYRGRMYRGETVRGCCAIDGIAVDAGSVRDCPEFDDGRR